MMSIDKQMRVTKMISTNLVRIIFNRIIIIIIIIRIDLDDRKRSIIMFKEFETEWISSWNRAAEQKQGGKISDMRSKLDKRTRACAQHHVNRNMIGVVVLYLSKTHAPPE